MGSRLSDQGAAGSWDNKTGRQQEHQRARRWEGESGDAPTVLHRDSLLVLHSYVLTILPSAFAGIVRWRGSSRRWMEFIDLLRTDTGTP